jgi:hypothetical protein
MPHRQTVEFLRRRYAAAILRDDADTAGRLRAQLDQLMNPARCTERLGAAARPDAPARPVEPPARPLATAGERACGDGEPRLHLVTPVTGLLDGPGRRLVIASSRHTA